MQQPALGFMKKSQVAQLYGISRKTLTNRIRQSQPLTDYLNLLNYNFTSHYFTLRQVLLIFKFLGYPQQYDYIDQRLVRYVPIKPYSRRELQTLYGIDYKTLWTYIEQVPYFRFRGITTATLYQTFSEKEIFHIFSFLGHPFYKSQAPIDDLPETEKLDNLTEYSIIYDSARLDTIITNARSEGYREAVEEIFSKLKENE